jgi:hypothetical protein
MGSLDDDVYIFTSACMPSDAMPPHAPLRGAEEHAGGITRPAALMLTAIFATSLVLGSRLDLQVQHT